LSNTAPDHWLDELLKLAAAAREMPGSRKARSMHPSALFRKIQEGKLQAVKCGRSLMTTRRWLREMLLREMNAYSDQRGINAPVKVRSKSALDRAADAAAKRLGVTIEDGE
jgi:hypothetical protein